MTTEQSHWYGEGWDAHYEGYARELSPYPPGSDAWGWWCRGWDDCEMED
jgi:hypothetical protein